MLLAHPESHLRAVMSVIPEEERDTEANVYTSYRLQSDKWYVNTFLMSWVPEK